jgi:broad specificity phosphatase PhoE
VEGTRIVLVRHGESVNQTEGLYGGHACQGLSDRGREQVSALRDRLARTGELASATRLYSSVMARAVETATILAPALGDLDVVQQCDFCEIHPGEADGLTWEEVERRYPSPERWTVDWVRDPGGESWAAMTDRVGTGLDELVERHPGETIVVACHGGVVVQSMLKWLGLDFAGERAWFQATNASMTEWRFAPNPFAKSTLGVELVRFNDHAHLASR